MINTILLIAVAIILISIIIIIIRFIKGPTAIDRVVAFDIMSVSTIALISILAHFHHKNFYLDVAIVYGLLGFLVVIIIAKYLEKSL